MIIVYCLLGLILAAALTAVIETRILRVTHYELDVGKNCSGIKKPLKVVIVSDLHCTRFGTGNRRLVERIAEQNADLVIVVGDVINGRPQDIRYATEFFGQLNDRGIDTVYVFGNHEQKLSLVDEDELDTYTSLMKKLVRVVNNETIEIGGLVIKGLLIPLKMYRDRMINISDYFDPVGLAGEFEDDGKYHILVAHDPTFAAMYSRIGADLIISGHLHGGIIRIPFIGGLISPRHKLFPRRTKGMFDEGKAKLLVTSGIGWHALPFRFFNDPQIAVLEIK